MVLPRPYGRGEFLVVGTSQRADHSIPSAGREMAAENQNRKSGNLKWRLKIKIVKAGI